MKMTLLTLKDGPIREFPWLPLTVLSQGYADHHFLYHLILAPFFVIAGPFLGIKIATTLLASTATTIFYGLLRSIGLKRHSFLFALLLIVCGGFFFRLNLAKTPAVAIIWFLLELLAIIKGRHWLLLILSFSHVWLHGSWMLLPVVFFLYLFAVWAVKVSPGSKKRPNYWKTVKEIIKDNKKMMAAIIGGLVGGLVINPFFPGNLRFYWEQIIQIALINYQGQLEVGTEWHGYSLINLIRQLVLLFVTLFIISVGIALSHTGNNRRIVDVSNKRAIITILSCLLTGLFFLMTIRQRRQVEYLAPALTLFMASLVSVFLPKISWRQIQKRWQGTTQRILSLFLSTVIIVACLSIVAGDAFQTKRYYEKIPKHRYKAAVNWIEANIPENELIVNLRWDDFPALFFQNDNYRWFGGLDPTFGYRADSDRWQSFRDIKDDAPEADPVGFLEMVGSHYYFIRIDKGIPKSISQESRLERAYHDEESAIFRLKQL